MKTIKISIIALASLVMVACGGESEGDTPSTCTGKTEVSNLEYDGAKQDFTIKGVKTEESEKYHSYQIMLVNYDTDDITVSNTKEGNDKLISIKLMKPNGPGTYTITGKQDGRFDFYVQDKDNSSRAYNQMNFEGDATVTIFEMSDTHVCGSVNIDSEDIKIKADFDTDNITKID